MPHWQAAKLRDRMPPLSEPPANAAGTREVPVKKHQLLKATVLGLPLLPLLGWLRQAGLLAK